MQSLLRTLTTLVILPLIEKLIKYFVAKVEAYDAAQKLKAENEAKEKELKAAKTPEEVKSAFEKMP